jgi:hypothetical protein
MSEAMFETVTSETVNTQSKPKAAPRGAVDGRVLAEVEKWMVMIREISREPVKN